MNRDLERASSGCPFAGLPPSAPVRRFEEARWAQVHTPRGTVVVGRLAALTRTRVRWAVGGAGAAWVAGVGVATAVGADLVATIMAAALIVLALVLLVRELVPSRAQRLLNERERVVRLAYARTHPAAEVGDDGWVPPPAEPPTEGGGGGGWGAVWRDQRALAGRRLPAVPDYTPVRRPPR